MEVCLITPVRVKGSRKYLRSRLLSQRDVGRIRWRRSTTLEVLEMPPSILVSRVQPKRGFQTPHGFLAPPMLYQYESKIIVRIGMVRRQTDRLPVLVDRLIELPLLGQRHTEVRVVGGLPWFQA